MKKISSYITFIITSTILLLSNIAGAATSTLTINSSGTVVNPDPTITFTNNVNFLGKLTGNGAGLQPTNSPNFYWGQSSDWTTNGNLSNLLLGNTNNGSTTSLILSNSSAVFPITNALPVGCYIFWNGITTTNFVVPPSTQVILTIQRLSKGGYTLTYQSPLGYDGGSFTNLTSTNITTQAGILTATSNGTNYTIPLVPGELPNTLYIYLSNTNANLTFTGTNQFNWGRGVFFDNYTNTAVGLITINANYHTNSNVSFYVTNGTGHTYYFWNGLPNGTRFTVFDGAQSQ